MGCARKSESVCRNSRWKDNMADVGESIFGDIDIVTKSGSEDTICV